MKFRSKMKRRFHQWLRSLGIITIPLGVAACTANGGAMGDVNAPNGELEGPVTLVWKSDALAPDRGQISGTLADGTHYAGRYIEVARTAEAELYAPAWEGWGPYWSEWAWDGEANVTDWDAFVLAYTGTVIANLRSDDGKTRLRCRIIIDTPTTGLAGGANGKCQRSDGATIDGVVLAPE